VVKRISILFLGFLLFSSVILFAENDFLSPKSEAVHFLSPIHFDRVLPKMRIEVFVNYPDSQPVSYVGRTIANLDDALLISINDKIYYIRKKFIEKLVIFSDRDVPLIAMSE